MWNQMQTMIPAYETIARWAYLTIYKQNEWANLKIYKQHRQPHLKIYKQIEGN